MRAFRFTCALLAATALGAGSVRADGLSIEALATQAVGGEPEFLPMSEAELADERGGFMTPLGEINFAATLTTLINGQVALQTTLTLTEAGLMQQQVASYVPQSLVQPAVGATSAGGVSPGQTLAATIGQTIAQATSPGANASTVTGTGVVDRATALDAATSALTPAVTALNEATSALNTGLANSGNPTATSQPTLQDAGGLASVANALPGGPAQQVVGNLASSLDGLVDAVTAYVPANQAAQTQQTPAVQTVVYTPEVLPQSSDALKAAAASAGINLGGLQGSGVLIPGETGGATAIIHNLTSQALTNTVVNTASNVDVALHTEINLVMPNLAQLQEDIASDSLTSSLHDAIGRALVGF